MIEDGTPTLVGRSPGRQPAIRYVATGCAVAQHRGNANEACQLAAADEIVAQLGRRRLVPGPKASPARSSRRRADEQTSPHFATA